MLNKSCRARKKCGSEFCHLQSPKLSGNAHIRSDPVGLNCQIWIRFISNIQINVGPRNSRNTGFPDICWSSTQSFEINLHYTHCVVHTRSELIQSKNFYHPFSVRGTLALPYAKSSHCYLDWISCQFLFFIWPSEPTYTHSTYWEVQGVRSRKLFLYPFQCTKMYVYFYWFSMADFIFHKI